MNPHLELLCRSIAEAVREAIRTGALARATTDWLVRRCDLDEGGMTHYTVSEKREAWDGDALQRLISTVISQETETYEAVTADLSQRMQVEAPSVRGHLHGLLLRVGQLYADSAGPEEVDSLITRFLEELAGGEISWRAAVWLRNMCPESHRLEIDDRTAIRRPIADDFELATPAAHSGFGYVDFLRADPDAILEVTEDAATRPAHKIRQFVNCLCLFRLGAISILKEVYSSNSTLSGRDIETWPSSSSVAPRFKYDLEPADCELLASFAKQIASRMPINPLGHHDDAQWNGLKFYFRALLNATDDEERIAQAVAAIEGLLCAGSRTDLTRTVSQRGASLLRLAGFDALEVKQDLSRAYGIRSAFAHGDQASQKLRRVLPQLCDRVMDYARLVVVKDIELRLLRGDRPLSRKHLSALLDAALLDEDSRTRLEQQVQGGLWDLAGPSRPPRVGQ